MSNKLESYKVKDWTVFGRTQFKAPFKVADALINEARIVMVVEGRSKLYSANQYIDLINGDMLIMKTDNFINNWIENDSDQLNKVIVFQLNADFLAHLYENSLPSWFDQNSEPANNSIVKAHPSPILQSFVSGLEGYLDTPEQLTEDIIKIKITELISLLVQNDSEGSIKNIFANLFKQTSYEFQEIIQKNLYEDLNIEDLAFFANMSVSSFKRKFSAVYGTTPNKYIVSRRLEKAQTLLSTTEQTIAEIAYDCGFSDVSYFSKTFRKYYSTSPSDLRN